MRAFKHRSSSGDLIDFALFEKKLDDREGAFRCDAANSDTENWGPRPARIHYTGAWQAKRPCLGGDRHMVEGQQLTDQAGTIGLFLDTWHHSSQPGKSLIQLYRRSVWLKANPRSENYMRALFRSRYPTGSFLNVLEHPGWMKEVASASEVVLLYPDATGLYFAPLERRVLSHVTGATAVRVLNGRRRSFEWSRRVRWALRMRRLIERAMLGELLAFLPFFVMTPFFLLSDSFKGRR
jgi:hypothetical protein